MKENWHDFFEMLLEHEGGFTDDQRDKGNSQGDGYGNMGTTMLGVTSWNWAKYTGKAAPPEVMKKLTKEDVEPLYKRNYWDVVKADDLPSGLDISVSDLAVNAGPSQASKLLQRVVGAAADGKIGPNTLRSVMNHEPKEILEKYYDARESFYRSLKDYEHFGRGWSRRNKETLEKALKLI